VSSGGAGISELLQGFLCVITAQASDLALHLFTIRDTDSFEVSGVWLLAVRPVNTHASPNFIVFGLTYPTAERRQALVLAAAAMLPRAKKERTIVDLANNMMASGCRESEQDRRLGVAGV
jgi:hypothetical protein